MIESSATLSPLIHLSHDLGQDIGENEHHRLTKTGE